MSSAPASGWPPASSARRRCRSRSLSKRMFATGALADATGLTSFVPLVEHDVETMSNRFGARASRAERLRGLLLTFLLKTSPLGVRSNVSSAKMTGPHGH